MKAIQTIKSVIKSENKLYPRFLRKYNDFVIYQTSISTMQIESCHSHFSAIINGSSVMAAISYIRAL